MTPPLGLLDRQPEIVASANVIVSAIAVFIRIPFSRVIAHYWLHANALSNTAIDHTAK
jgi:hypothetical protein